MSMTNIAFTSILKKKLIHKSSFVHGLINIGSIKKWLDHLIRTPLYQHYKITVNESFFNQETPLITQQNIDEFSENIDIEDSQLLNNKL